jgi:adenine-specific DNA-methyltransferase
LKILLDREGKRLKEYQVEVVNDELIVTDEEGELFEYNPSNRESQRIQETLFHEKQTIIENCLFGVDINSNSVKICRLRLWIELLKNAYYKTDIAHGLNRRLWELETLPNIDINIKCGNSLVSRFAIDADLKQALKKSKWTIETYKLAVQSYRQARNKEEKKEMERLILQIKQNFTSEIRRNDPIKKRLDKLASELYHRFTGTYLFEPEASYNENDKKIEKKREIEQIKLEKEIEELNNKIEEIKANKIFENAFEWRFEFPEVLNDEGDFVGFDVVIGNPPYIPLEAFEVNERNFFNSKYTQLERKYETSVPFILEGLKILNNKGLLAYIAPVTWQTGENYSKFRNHFFEQYGLLKLINLPFNIFEDAYVDTALYFISKEAKSEYLIYAFDKKARIETLEYLEYNKFKVSEIKAPNYKVIIDKTAHQFSRFDSEYFVPFGSITKSTQGLSGSNFPESNTAESEFIFPFLSKGNVYNFSMVKDSVYITDLADKKNLVQFYQAHPKILIRRIISRQDRLSVTYCDEKLVFKKDINPFIPIDKNFDCYFLTGIVASKLISFIYLNSSSIATKDDFRQTTLSELRKLPIPNIDINKQKPISDIVKQILRLKSERSNSDTTDLENQIDQLVYQLYELTEEEIKIIEGN